MAAAVLTSNHVNYLIWRYLQESGYGEAAVKLQRDWMLDPQSLPFAQHIKTHALVVLLQKGIQYHEIQQTFNHNNHGTRSSPATSTFFFGPESIPPISTPNEEVVSGDDAAGKSRISPRTRKHGRENSTNGVPLDMPTPAPAAKRSRRSNGTEATNGDRGGSDNLDYEPNGYLPPKSEPPEPPEPSSNINSPAEESQTAADGAGMGMDVDDDAPAPEHARMTLTLTNGQSVGVQSDQVTELEPETINLSVPDTNVMHTAWNPRDPAILATGGQALSRIWTISRSTPPHQISPNPNDHHHHHHDENPNPNDPNSSNPNNSNPNNPNNPNPNSPKINSPNPNSPKIKNSNSPNSPNSLNHFNNSNGSQYIDTLDPSNEALMVSSVAWRPDGDVLAVATRGDVSNCAGAVSLWTKKGKCIDELPAAQDTVLGLRWNSSGSYLLGITTAGTANSAMVVWDTQTSKALPPVHLDHIVMDAAWADAQTFTICGDGVIGNVTVDSECIVNLRPDDEPGIEKKWTNIQRDNVTNTVAMIADEEAIIGIIDPSGRLHTTVGHDAQITAMAFQPVPDPSSYASNSARLLVTASLDGTVKVWNAAEPFTTIHVISFTAMTISFAPDGRLFAAANWNRVLIWNAEEGGSPKASWKGEQGKWQGLTNGVDQDSGTGEEEDGPLHLLSWDVDGGRLAYGLGSQIAIINVRPHQVFNPENIAPDDMMHE